MLSAVAGTHAKDGGGKTLILAHRDELTHQNREKFARINPSLATSIYDATQKSWDGQAVFAMVPTLSRQTNLDTMPALDLLVIDEAHHAIAESYQRIINFARQTNPDCRIYGVTATPNRGDKKGLRDIFTNVADQIHIGELIQSGHLVKPRTFVIDVGVRDDLSKVRTHGNDFDMNEVDKIMNKTPVNEAVVKHWQDKAGNRPTVVFSSTVNHAREITETFNRHCVPAALITGEMDSSTRRQVMEDYACDKIKVLVNISVLTEGWDHPPTSCVILLRPSSYKSTMIQMVGRGLRIVDPEEYPGVIKTDCIILDFGTSSLVHGYLEQDADLAGSKSAQKAPERACPSCEAVLPPNVRECALCGHCLAIERERNEPLVLHDFVMTEIDLLKRSNFRWTDLFYDDAAFMAAGFHAWAGCFYFNGRWHGIGGTRDKKPRLLALGDRLVCLAAGDDWLNRHETDKSAHKSKSWLREPPTEKQLALLPPEFRLDYSLTRAHASALITFSFNKPAIRTLVISQSPTPLDHAA